MREEKNKRNRLPQLILDIERVMESYRTKFAIEVTRLVPGRLDLLKRLIFSEISEIVTILKMIHKSMDDLYADEEKMNELRQRLPSGTVDEKNPDGSEFISITNRHMEIISELKIHIKTLYEWLYHLSELIQSHHKIRPLVSQKPWEVLQSHCAFRSKLITHKKGIQVYLMGGGRFSARAGSIELLMMPFSPPELAIKEINTLFSQCTTNLITEEATEVNFYERCRILYRNLDKFTGTQRAIIISFIERYGTISAQPVDIAEYVRDLVREFMPKLSKIS